MLYSVSCKTCCKSAAGSFNAGGLSQNALKNTWQRHDSRAARYMSVGVACCGVYCIRSADPLQYTLQSTVRGHYAHDTTSKVTDRVQLQAAAHVDHDTPLPKNMHRFAEHGRPAAAAPLRRLASCMQVVACYIHSPLCVVSCDVRRSPPSSIQIDSLVSDQAVGSGGWLRRPL